MTTAASMSRYFWRGFTLIEFAMTMVMIGVLSAAVMIKISARTGHSVTIQADQFRRDLSHIQMLALSRGSRLRLTINANGTAYTVATCTTSNCTNTSALVDPATGQSFGVTLTDGAAFGSANYGDVLDFDSLGRPNEPDGTLITANPARTYTLSDGVRGNVTVTVLPITGFAQTSY